MHNKADHLTPITVSVVLENFFYKLNTPAYGVQLVDKVF